jgi:hypothetical protein
VAPVKRSLIAWHNPLCRRSSQSDQESCLRRGRPHDPGPEPQRPRARPDGDAVQSVHIERHFSCYDHKKLTLSRAAGTVSGVQEVIDALGLTHIELLSETSRALIPYLHKRVGPTGSCAAVRLVADHLSSAADDRDQGASVFSDGPHSQRSGGHDAGTSDRGRLALATHAVLHISPLCNARLQALTATLRTERFWSTYLSNATADPTTVNPYTFNKILLKERASQSGRRTLSLLARYAQAMEYLVSG